MPRSRLPLAGLLAALVLLLAAAPARAQAAALDGTYVYDAARSDDVNRAIDQAIAKMSFVLRPVARSRLRKTNTAYERLSIAHTADRVSIVTDARAPVVTPANGATVKWTREDGEVFDVSTRWAGDALEQTFVAEDGRRVNRYTVAPDGTLTLHVTVTSPRLPRPVVYALRYRRAG